MNEINFTKMNGAGNDFVLIDANKNPELNLNQELIRTICNRRKGIGGDGILFIKPSTLYDYDYELEYYNSDGSLGSLCGNGARCSIKYAFENLIIESDKTKFSCNKNLYTGCKNQNGSITFNFLEPQEPKLNLNIYIDGNNIRCHFIDTGSPHAIIFWEEIEPYYSTSYHDFDIIEFGKKVRFTKEFSPEGTNVNVIHKEDGKWYIRTYERGVEDETLACGTGTVAASIITSLLENVLPPITFNTFDKDLLLVDFTKKNERFAKISLTGPAKINYIGSYNF